MGFDITLKHFSCNNVTFFGVIGYTSTWGKNIVLYELLLEELKDEGMMSNAIQIRYQFLISYYFQYNPCILSSTTDRFSDGVNR